MTKQDFDQALCDVKPVSIPSSHVIWLWCHYHPQAFGVSSEQLDDYMGNGELNNIVYKFVHMSILEWGGLYMNIYIILIIINLIL